MKRYEYFESTTQGSFDGVQETIQAILEGLAYLGQSKNFESGANGYQATDLSARVWYSHLTKYNQDNQEDHYEIREIKTKYGTVYQVLKNGKIQKKASEELQKSKVMETVGMMAELTPELIKTLVGIDDIEVLMDDGSTKLQKAGAGFWLLLSVLPPDKLKDILKSAKLAQHSNKAFDAVKLTEKEWNALKALDKANDAIKVEKNTGKVIGQLGKLTDDEVKAVNKLVGEGKTVEIIPVDPNSIIKTPDFKIDSVLTELKTLSNPNTNTGMKRIQEAFKQNTNNVIINGIDAGLTKEQAKEILSRAAGKFSNGKFPGKVEIWTVEGIIKSN
ncbi:CdiA C-terminal domain-containing protein [Carnobacterium gallinarum]|uniref:CdiA C-terminal domain-containing protein n=1 Tax=Carnobacterium gallinarum TaxID=2749 RepID=UPI00055066EA|nr:hypothetical protein [Carnobacterium gallinarum]